MGCRLGTILLFIFVLCVADTSSQSRIAMRDHEFVGEDPVLEKALARHMERPTPKESLSPPPIREPGPLLPSRRGGSYGKDNQSATYLERYEKIYKLGPEQKHYHWMQITCIEQSIFSVQQRLRETEWIIAKYKDDLTFRLAMAFHKLDSWKRDMHEMWAYATWVGIRQHPNGTYIKSNHSLPMHKNVKWHIRYYTYFVRHHIDITLSMDYLLTLHNRIQNKTLEFNTKYSMTNDRRSFD